MLTNKYDCTSAISVNDTVYPVRYYIKAVDFNNDKSVASDFAQTFGVKQGISDPNGPDNIPIYENVPKEYALKQNYPNPFNPVTNIQYDLPIDNFVTIKVYDLIGREVMSLVNEMKEAGSYMASFNGTDLPSGIYYYRIKAGGYEQVRKMILIK